jgi:hypothetical protein
LAYALIIGVVLSDELDAIPPATTVPNKAAHYY